MKRLSLYLLLTFSCLYCVAAYKPVDLKTNSHNGVYKAGEKVIVWAETGEGCADDLIFTVEENMSGTIIEKNISLKEGKTVLYSKKHKDPIHLVFKVALAENPKRNSSVGIIVAPEKFTTGFKAPGDLREFWDDQIAQMRKMPMEPVLTKVKSPDPQIECYDLMIPMPEGNPAWGYVAFPKKAAEKSLPILIYAHSAGVEQPDKRSNIETAVKDARRGNGAIAIDINAHGMPSDQPQEYYDSLAKGPLKGYHSHPIKGHESIYFRLMYLRLVRALDYLVTLPQWDGERVLIYGRSQGGGQAGALAGIDSRITASCMEVPGMMDIGAKLDNGRKGSYPSGYAKHAEREKERTFVPYYDAALLLGMTKADIFMEAGLIDTACPAPCIAAGYNNAASPEKKILFSPYRPHSSKSIDFRHKQEWKESILDAREAFIENHLK